MTDIDSITNAVIDRIAERLLSHYTHKADGTPIILNAQELRIARMLGQGMKLKDIADALGFTSQNDIHNRVRLCCRKHGITRYQLAVYGAFLAMRQGDL